MTKNNRTQKGRIKRPDQFLFPQLKNGINKIRGEKHGIINLH